MKKFFKKNRSQGNNSFSKDFKGVGLEIGLCRAFP